MLAREGGGWIVKVTGSLEGNRFVGRGATGKQYVLV